MSKESDLKKEMIRLFRSAGRNKQKADEYQELLRRVEFDYLLQALRERAQTVYDFRMKSDGVMGYSYCGLELFDAPATLLFVAEGESTCESAIFRHDYELWLMPDMSLEVTSCFRISANAGRCVMEYRADKGNYWEGTEIYVDLIALSRHLRELSTHPEGHLPPKFEL